MIAGEWIVMHIAAPMGPLVVGFVIRFIMKQGLSLDCLGTVELSFSMATISLLMILLTGSGLVRRKEESLARIVKGGFGILLFCSIAVFALTVAAETKMLICVPSFLSALQSPGSTPVDSLNHVAIRAIDSMAELGRARGISLGLSGVTLVFAMLVGSRMKYRC